MITILPFFETTIELFITLTVKIVQQKVEIITRIYHVNACSGWDVGFTVRADSQARAGSFAYLPGLFVTSGQEGL